MATVTEPVDIALRLLKQEDTLDYKCPQCGGQGGFYEGPFDGEGGTDYDYITCITCQGDGTIEPTHHPGQDNQGAVGATVFDIRDEQHRQEYDVENAMPYGNKVVAHGDGEILDPKRMGFSRDGRMKQTAHPIAPQEIIESEHPALRHRLPTVYTREWDGRPTNRGLNITGLGGSDFKRGEPVDIALRLLKGERKLEYGVYAHPESPEAVAVSGPLGDGRWAVGPTPRGIALNADRASTRIKDDRLVFDPDFGEETTRRFAENQAPVMAHEIGHSLDSQFGEGSFAQTEMPAHVLEMATREAMKLREEKYPQEPIIPKARNVLLDRLYPEGRVIREGDPPPTIQTPEDNPDYQYDVTDDTITSGEPMDIAMRLLKAKSKGQESLTEWTKEKWEFVGDDKKEMKKPRHKRGRYAPKSVADSMSPSQKATENKTKRAAHKKGKQHAPRGKSVKQMYRSVEGKK